MAVITDRRIVKELIDKKSNITSHRPPSFVSHDLITKGDHILVMDYGNKWRAFRRLIHQSLMESVVESDHLRIIDAEAVQLVRDYMLHPHDHMLHPKRFSNSIISSIGEYSVPEQIEDGPGSTNSIVKFLESGLVTLRAST